MTVVDLDADGLAEWRWALRFTCPGCGNRSIVDGVCTPSPSTPGACGARKITQSHPPQEVVTCRPSTPALEETSTEAGLLQDPDSQGPTTPARDSEAVATYEPLAPPAPAPKTPKTKAKRRVKPPPGPYAAPAPAVEPEPEAPVVRVVAKPVGPAQGSLFGDGPAPRRRR